MEINIWTFRATSVRGRVAYALVCLEEVILRLAPNAKQWTWLLGQLWEYPSKSSLDEWQVEMAEVTPSVVLYYETYVAKDFDYLTEANFSMLRKLYESSDPALTRLVELVFDIGTVEMYGGLDGGAPESLHALHAVLSLLREKGIPAPSPDLVAERSFRDCYGWGTPFDPVHLRRIGKQGSLRGAPFSAMRTLRSVLDELRGEHHVPMVALVEELRQQDWAATLGFDLSMLRLWICRQGSDAVEVMVVYGDGRGGGRPVEPYLDAFETTIFEGAEASEVNTGTRENTIETLRHWLESERPRGIPPG